MTFSDSKIAKYLNDHFVICWQSVCPVRVVTFDLGEGRSFKGTVNGEIAIHFCGSDGKTFDILPALQSPAVTLAAIKEADAQFKLVKGSLSKSRVEAYHREKLKAIASRRFDTLLIEGVKVFKDPSVIKAWQVYPDTKKGEIKRDAYIRASIDPATEDLRVMSMSKVGSMGMRLRNNLAGGAMTVVEPGGKGYYEWQISRVFLNRRDVGFGSSEGRISEKAKAYWAGVDRAKLTSKLVLPAGSAVEIRSPFISPRNPLMTPEQWKSLLFTGIMKQELKGGNVKYNSESLDAISIME